jgi:CheY-like chemotaxis protein
VALTAYSRPKDRDLAISAGYTMHVPKPVDPEKVIEIVASLAADRPA